MLLKIDAPLCLVSIVMCHSPPHRTILHRFLKGTNP